MTYLNVSNFNFFEWSVIKWFIEKIEIHSIMSTNNANYVCVFKNDHFSVKIMFFFIV